MSDSTILFGIFPYLTTNASLCVRGIHLQNSDVLNDLEPDIREHLKRLCGMFFAGDGVQIDRMTCCQVRLHDEFHYREAMLRLYEVRLLLGYLYSSPSNSGDVFLPAESTSLFAFRPDRIPTSLARNTLAVNEKTTLLIERDEPASGFLEGYAGKRNLHVNLWVADGSRIYPELHHQTLNFSQYIDRNLAEFLHHEQNWAFKHLYFDEREPESRTELRQRIFHGLDWYVRSCRGSISHSEALVNLAIALESLMKVSNGKDLTDRFKESVLTLIGPVPRLDSWLEQFYTARSKAVHEGVPHELSFLAVDKESAKKARRGDKDVFPHRSLIEYGRRIFRLCLTNLVSAAENVAAIELDKLFVHNVERVQTMTKLLNDSTLSCDDKLTRCYSISCDLLQFQNILNEPHVEFSAVLHVAKRLLKVFKETKPNLSDAAENAIQAFINETNNIKANSMQISAMESILSVLRKDSYPYIEQFEVIIKFLTFATKASFKLHFLFEENPKL